MKHIGGKRIAAPLVVKSLYLQEHHVGTVGNELVVLYIADAKRGGLACGLYVMLGESLAVGTV